MTARDITIIDEDDRRALVTRSGPGWSVVCIADHNCPPIVGYTRRMSGIGGAEAHLRWHANGRPTCADCGNPLPQAGSKRCRRGTCEATR